MKIYQIAIAFLSCSLIFSCKFNEDIYLKSDGKMDYKMTMSMSMPMGKMLESLNIIDSNEKNENKEVKEEVNIDKFSLDTTMYFSDIIKAMKEEKSDIAKKLTKDEREALKYIDFLNPFVMRMKMGKEDMLVEFAGKNLADTALNFAYKAMQSKSIQGSINKDNMMSGDKNSSIMSKKNVAWDGKTFIYKGEPIEKKEVSKKKNSKKLDNSDLTKMMMQGAFVRTFKFDKPIKSINVKTAEMSEDKKTVTITYDMAEYESRLKANDIKVELE